MDTFVQRMRTRREAARIREQAFFDAIFDPIIKLLGVVIKYAFVWWCLAGLFYLVGCIAH